MHQQSRPLRRAASQAKPPRGQLPTADDCAHGKHQTRDNHAFDRAGHVVDLFLLGEVRKAVIAISQIFRIRKTGNKNVRNDRRFYKQNSHYFSPPQAVVFVAQGEDKHGGLTSSSAQPHPLVRNTQFANGHGKRFPTSVLALGERLPQITDKTARNAIGQDQSSDNSPLVQMVDPSDNSNVTIDRLDLHASAESVGNHDGLGQGRLVCIVGHRSSQFFNSLRTVQPRVTDTADASLLPAPADQFSVPA